MDYPKISIVTPSFNQAGYLEETILSVLNQNYPNLEYVIIDGGSTDGSVEIIRKYEKQLKYWVSEKDGGMYEAIQKGFAQTTGEVMGWINSDDLLFPKSLFVAGDVFRTIKEVDWILGCSSIVDEQSRIVKSFNARKWCRFDFLSGDYRYIQQESTFWRRSLWNAAGSAMNTSLRYAGDMELWLRFFDHAQLHVLRTVLGAFRVRSSNQFTVERLDDYHREAEDAIRKKVESLSGEDRGKVERILALKRKGNKGWFGKKRANELSELLKYPRAIVYQRSTNSFEYGQ